MKIPVLRVGNVLLTSLQGYPSDRDLQDMQSALLETVGRSTAQGVVLDISGLETADSFIVKTLSETAQMARVLGCEVVVSGMTPSVAMTLIRMEVRLEGFATALDLEAGLKLVRRLIDDDHDASERGAKVAQEKDGNKEAAPSADDEQDAVTEAR